MSGTRKGAPGGGTSPPPGTLVQSLRRSWSAPIVAAASSIRHLLVGPTRPTEPSSLLGGGRGWAPASVREPFPGAWQQNVEAPLYDVLTYPTVYACVTLIACDVGKMRIRLVELSDDGIWDEVDSPAFSPVLRKPNRWQNRMKFYEQWVRCKLTWGNTYVLKARDDRGVVIRMTILDPSRVRPHIAPDGSVWYAIGAADELAGLDVPDEPLMIPARDIIHDVMVPLYHPLCGVSPITACGLAAVQGLRIQGQSAQFFANHSQPGGVLTAPGAIEDATATRLKTYWEENFTGVNAGRVAVLGDGLHYEPLAVNAVDAELIKQLQWSDEKICSVFHVPAFMVGVGPDPNYANITQLSTQYYAQCVQTLIESIELLLDDGLELPKPYGTEFDLDDLLRMDPAAMIESERTAVAAGIKAPNESRKRLNLAPVVGGDTPYLQVQNYSLAALAARDAAAEKAAANPPPVPPPPDADDPDDDDDDPDRDPDDDGDDDVEAELTAGLTAALLQEGARL